MRGVTLGAAAYATGEEVAGGVGEGDGSNIMTKQAVVVATTDHDCFCWLSATYALPSASNNPLTLLYYVN